MITLVFISLRVLPGDVTVVILGEQGYTLEKAATLRRQLGLDRPLHQQYVKFLWDLLHGDLGNSLITGREVAADLRMQLLRTAELTLLAVPLGTLVGIPLGAIAALRRNSISDIAVSLISLVGISVPLFASAYVLVYFFSIKLPLLPSAGFVPLMDDPVQHLRRIILPTICLMFWPAAVAMRMMRSSLLEVMHEDYIRTARAKGLREPLVIIRHAFRNALIPVVSIVGLQIGTLFAGAVVAESIFSWPGMGLYLYDGLLRRDLPVVQGAIIVMAVIFSVANLLVDLLYSVLDPRIRMEISQ